MIRSHTFCTGIALVSSLAFVGCTTTRFAADNAHEQGQTTVDLQYREALDNLAMFLYYGGNNKNPDVPLPWHHKYSAINSSVTDSLSPSFSFTWPAISRNVGTNTSGRTWQVQWTSEPEVDGKALRRIQGHYLDVLKQPDFGDHFEVLEGPIRDELHGQYKTIYVRPKPGHLRSLNELVFRILESGPAKPVEPKGYVPLR